MHAAGNRLWEQWLVNRHGVGGFDARTHESLGDNWPAELGAEYRDFTINFQERTHEILLKILRALALGLGWEESFFDEVYSHCFDSMWYACRGCCALPPMCTSYLASCLEGKFTFNFSTWILNCTVLFHQHARQLC